MSDIERIRRNLRSMIEQGATEAETEAYLAQEGTSAEGVRAGGGSTLPGGTRGPLLDAASGVAGVAEDVVGRIQGKQDPRYKDVPAYPADEPGWHGAADLGALFTDNDKDYAAIIKEGLGDKYIGSETDANGYEIITYRGDDGKEYPAYINKPGLDLSDVNRELMAMTPAVGAGTAVNYLMRKLGLPLIPRMVGMGATEAATSGARDVTAANLGADFDPMASSFKMLIAAGGGSLFEGLSGPVTNLWRRLFSDPKMVDAATGALTASGRQAAVAAGLDPETMDTRLAELFQQQLSQSASPREAAAAARTQEFNVPTTRGQRTKSPNDLGMEQEARHGSWGDAAHKIVAEFDASQKSAIDRAVDDVIGLQVAPRQGGRETHTLGTRIQEGSRDARDVWKKEEDRLWNDARTPLQPDPRYVNGTLSPILRDTLKDMAVTQTNTPTAYQMMDLLQDFTEGKAITAPHRLLAEAGQEGQKNIDQIRRDLFGLMNSAPFGSPDRKAAGKVYDSYLQWIDYLAERGALVGGTAEDIAALKLARGFTRDVKELFGPRTNGKSNEAAAKITKIMEDTRTSSGEDVVRALFGAGGPTAGAGKGTVQALRHLRAILRAGGEAGQDAWDDVRLAYWMRLVRDRKGSRYSPKMLRNNIEAAFTNQKSVIDAMYTEEEQRLMRRFAAAMEDVDAVDMNPSKTSREMLRQRNRGQGIIKGAAKVQEGRARLGKDVGQFLFWKLLNRYQPFVGGQAIGSGKIGRKLTDQTTRPKPSSPVFAPVATWGALEATEGEDPMDMVLEGLQ